MLAAEPATKPAKPSVLAPTTPAEPRGRPAIIDPRQPAFVPKFAQINNPPGGQYAERQYAERYTYPTFCGYSYGYGSYGGSYGCTIGGGYFGGAAWGGGFTAWH
ncbi:MAG: hypothetical protein JWM57_20 [Phycisphaerales bacterium]|nr:hypothetical protein [Phycisphaerales bacterium]